MSVAALVLGPAQPDLAALLLLEPPLLLAMLAGEPGSAAGELVEAAGCGNCDTAPACCLPVPLLSGLPVAPRPSADPAAGCLEGAGEASAGTIAPSRDCLAGCWGLGPGEVPSKGPPAAGTSVCAQAMAALPAASPAASTGRPQLLSALTGGPSPLDAAGTWAGVAGTASSLEAMARPAGRPPCLPLPRTGVAASCPCRCCCCLSA